jgi:hypothetical protein
VYQANLLIYDPCFDAKLTHENEFMTIDYSFLENNTIEFANFELDLPECGGIKYSKIKFISKSGSEVKVYKSFDRDPTTKEIQFFLDNEVKD